MKTIDSPSALRDEIQSLDKKIAVLNTARVKYAGDLAEVEMEESQLTFKDGQKVPTKSLKELINTTNDVKGL